MVCVYAPEFVAGHRSVCLVVIISVCGANLAIYYVFGAVDGNEKCLWYSNNTVSITDVRHNIGLTKERVMVRMSFILIDINGNVSKFPRKHK